MIKIFLDNFRGVSITYHTYQTRSQCEIFKRILKRDSSRALCHRPASPPMAAAVSPGEDLMNEWRRKVSAKVKLLSKGCQVVFALKTFEVELFSYWTSKKRAAGERNSPLD